MHEGDIIVAFLTIEEAATQTWEIMWIKDIDNSVLPLDMVFTLSKSLVIRHLPLSNNS